ncbi:DMT family transporter [Candidatus Azoamicus ciliaticola]|uniref:S-adenosylmethionine/S-adenosylhomocysteine transporter n=1 Tax=Candidatus Azoamicus ciliaticola TaxID=2652803 RepID=A0A6J5JXZ5_9GAMM|nr:DMT family transporter [Candidatus Azoamicus ciliaticola]CAB3976392.1 S-adenosylmethionine/S-adenosylhomocysteine transporter [Candidatus Azoamicus ciliaticola]
MKKIRLLLVFLLFALFASVFSLQKICLCYADPLFLMGFRMALSGFLLIFILFLNGKIKIKKEHFYLFFLLGLFNIYFTNIFEILGLKTMSSAKACLIYSLSPFLTAFIAPIFLNEFITARKFFGILIGFFGLIPMIYIKSLEELNIKTIWVFSMSELFLLFAVFFSVIGWIFLKKIQLKGYSFFLANGISMFFGGFCILITSFVVNENWNPFPIYNLFYFMFFTFLTAIISNIICYNLFGYLLNYFSATFMTFSGLMTPFFAAFFGYFFLKEGITWHFFLSVFIFFFGLLIFYFDEKN